MAKKLWGNILALASFPIAVGAGLTKGAYDAATGKGSFKDGFEEISNTVVDKAIEFGDENSDKITTGIIAGATVALGKKGLENMGKKGTP